MVSGLISEQKEKRPKVSACEVTKHQKQTWLCSGRHRMGFKSLEKQSYYSLFEEKKVEPKLFRSQNPLSGNNQLSKL